MTPRFPRGIMATCCIPWDEHYRLAESIFRRQIAAALARGAEHLYVFGTAGEGYAVTDAQFDQIVSVFADEMRRSKAEPMVGVISLSLGTILERIERCRDRGVTRFQISLPSWGAPDDRELFGFFDAVCGRFLDCQFLHYNLLRGKRLLTGPEYGRLSEIHENLVATKNCGDSMSHLRSLLEDAPRLRHFLSESGFAYGSLFGECGLLASFIMNWPRLRELYEAGCRRDVGTMTLIQREATLVLRSIFEAVPGSRIDGAYDKLYEKLYDPEYPLRLLPPYLGATDAEFRSLVELLRARVPAWLPNSQS